jgi:hypothetical protein
MTFSIKRVPPRFLATSIAFLLVHSVVAQTAAVQGVDDPGVLWGYFSLHLAIEHQAAAQDPSLRHSAALMMGITDADFALLTRVAQSVETNIRDISNEEVAVLGSAAPAGASGDIAKQFRVRREAALMVGLKAAQNRLTAQSWNALRAYINGRYRNSVRNQTVTTK